MACIFETSRALAQTAHAFVNKSDTNNVTVHLNVCTQDTCVTVPIICTNSWPSATQPTTLTTVLTRCYTSYNTSWPQYWHIATLRTFPDHSTDTLLHFVQHFLTTVLTHCHTSYISWPQYWHIATLHTTLPDHSTDTLPHFVHFLTTVLTHCYTSYNISWPQYWHIATLRTTLAEFINEL